MVVAQRHRRHHADLNFALAHDGLQRATAEAAQFNASPKNLTVGVMRAFASMDGVSKVFHVYTDKLGNLASQLSLADNNKQQGN